MFVAVALAIALGQAIPASGTHTASVFATIGHSEWCPAGHATLDLRTGRYVLTPRAPRQSCNDPNLERPVVTRRLDPAAAAAIRAAYARAQAEGLKSEACRTGKRPEIVILSNGGVPVLVLTNGRSTISAPDDQSCWSEAASALYEELDRAFSPADYR